MGLFSRRSKLPPQRDLARMLAEWGQSRFDGESAEASMSPDAKQFKDEMMNMGFHRDSAFPDRLQATVQEIRDVGLREGRWAVVGAWKAVDVIHAPFGDLHAPDDVMEELLEARVRFLQSLNEPELAQHMNSNDLGRLLRLFPDDYARLFPR